MENSKIDNIHEQNEATGETICQKNLNDPDNVLDTSLNEKIDPQISTIDNNDNNQKETKQSCQNVVEHFERFRHEPYNFSEELINNLKNKFDINKEECYFFY